MTLNSRGAKQEVLQYQLKEWDGFMCTNVERSPGQIGE